MKKIPAILCFLALIASPQLSFAGGCTSNCGRSATTAIREVNDYLINDNLLGVNYINGCLKDGAAKAKVLKADALLAEFIYDENLGSETITIFRFIGTNDKDKIYQYSGAIMTVQDNTFGLNYGILSIPMRMRDLTKSMLEDPKLLPFLDSLFGPNAVVQAGFRLAKNPQNRLVWTITFSDTNTGKTYLVNVSAESTHAPTFTVLSKR